jgi:hypothetical protein
MSLVVKLMIGGWTGTLVMIGFCALNESGKLFPIRKRLASWLEPATPNLEKTVYPSALEAD